MLSQELGSGFYFRLNLWGSRNKLHEQTAPSYIGKDRAKLHDFFHDRNKLQDDSDKAAITGINYRKTGINYRASPE